MLQAYLEKLIFAKVMYWAATPLLEWNNFLAFAKIQLRKHFVHCFRMSTLLQDGSGPPTQSVRSEQKKQRLARNSPFFFSHQISLQTFGVDWYQIWNSRILKRKFHTQPMSEWQIFCTFMIGPLCSGGLLGKRGDQFWRWRYFAAIIQL